jgi:hypothetical protein
MVDSKHEQLSNEEIIQIASQNTGSPYSPEQVLAALMSEVRMPDTLAIQQGNTLFVVHRSKKEPDVAFFRALNADTAPNYLENSFVFTETMKSMGFRAMVSTFYDSTILNIFKYISKNPPFPGMGYKVQRTKDDGFYVTVNLGSDPGGLSATRGAKQ